ncbi:MAG TPA: M42 family metallopeptidase [Bacillales bacterium]|nr:M42 family metallopeptidase [Bacillales bacterium]
MGHVVNDDEIVKVIDELVNIPSPTGNTSEIIKVIDDRLRQFGVATKVTRKGALLATLQGEDDTRHRFVTAHVDALGAMVKQIKENGRLTLSRIGGFPWNHAEGEYCTIETSGGKRYGGTIVMHQTAVHVYKDAGEAKRNDENIEVRIDEKVRNAKDVRNLGIEVGDFVSFDPRFESTDSGFVKSRHLDDKASVAILLEVVRQLVENKIKLPYTTHFLIANNEEIGYGANSNVSPETIEYLAVDMGAIGDGQTTDEFTVSICAKDTSGPYHYGLRKHLVKLAEKHNIGFQVDIYPFYNSDASAAVRAGHDIIHGLIGPGVDASHAYERTHRESLVSTGDLIYHYLQSKMIS